MKKALVILADGFEEIEAVVPIDLMRRAGINVTVAGLHSSTIKGSHSLCVNTDMLLLNAGNDYDAIILPGGMPGTTNLASSELVLNIVKTAFNDGRLCAAICAAPLVFFMAGILENKNYTCFPGIKKKIKAGTWIEQNVVRDGSIITSRAAGTAVEFSLEVIRYLVDNETAAQISRTILHNNQDYPDKNTRLT